MGVYCGIFIVVVFVSGSFIFRGIRLLREARKYTIMAANLEMDLTNWNPESKSILDALQSDPVLTERNIERWKRMKPKEITADLKTLASYRRGYASDWTLKAMIQFVLATFIMGFAALLVSVLSAGWD